MDECPRCELNKLRAANWRAEAYRLAGHDVIERPWVGLTDEEILQTAQKRHARINNNIGNDLLLISFARTIEAKLKEKNT